MWNKRRPPERIRPLLDLIEVYWKENPDLRLGQIIGNFASDAHKDPYHFEDLELFAVLQEELLKEVTPDGP